MMTWEAVTISDEEEEDEKPSKGKNKMEPFLDEMIEDVRSGLDDPHHDE